MTKRKAGRPMKGTIPARALPQLAIRLTPELEKTWNQLRRDYPYHTHSDLLEMLLDLRQYQRAKRSA